MAFVARRIGPPSGRAGVSRDDTRRERMTDLALAVRQPWAWAIIHAGKDVENRSPTAVRYMTHRGRVAIQASKGMTQDEYRSATEFMARFGVVCPPAAALVRGAVIGTVEVYGLAKESASPWWMGPRGLLLRNPTALLRPIPSGGSLGFYRWKPSGGEAEKPLAWMLPGDRRVQPSLPLL